MNPTTQTPAAPMVYMNSWGLLATEEGSRFQKIKAQAAVLLEQVNSVFPGIPAVVQAEAFISGQEEMLKAFVAAANSQMEQLAPAQRRVIDEQFSAIADKMFQTSAEAISDKSKYLLNTLAGDGYQKQRAAAQQAFTNMQALASTGISRV